MKRPWFPRLTMIMALLIINVVVGFNGVPATASPQSQAQPQQRRFTYTRIMLPRIVKVSTPTPPIVTTPKIVVWIDAPTKVKLSDRLKLVINIQNQGDGDLNGRTDVVIPYDGRQFTAVDTSFTPNKGDWVKANTFPGQLTVEFGSIRRGETRSGTIYYALNSNGATAKVGDRLRVQGTYNNGKNTCGGVTCYTNDRTVEVIASTSLGGPKPQPDHGTTVGLGTVNEGTQLTWTPGGYVPGETVVTWINTSGVAKPEEFQLQQKADNAGKVYFKIQTHGLKNGFYSLVAHGKTSKLENVATFGIKGAKTSLAAWHGIRLIPFAAPAAAVDAASPRLAALGTAQTTGVSNVQGVVAASGTNGATRLDGVQVSVVAADGSIVGSSYTDSYGGYEVDGLPAGTYTVTFDPSYSFDSNAQRFQNMSVANVVVAATGSVVLDAELVPGSTISGRVNSATIGGLGGVSVELLSGDTLVETAITEDDGSYMLNGVPSGTYTLVFDPTYAADDEVQSYIATQQGPVTVTAPAPLSNQNVTLELNTDLGTISGQVVAGDSGLPLGDVFVIFDRFITETSTFEYAASAVTGSDGSYTSALPPGSYQVSFLPNFSDNPQTASYLSEYFDNVASGPTGATLILVNGGEVDRADAALAPGNTISGTVTGDGAPLEDVAVLTTNADNSISDITFTDETGAYTTAGLPAGSYNVEFVTFLSSVVTTTEYIGTSISTPVALGASGDVTGVDAALVKGGTISGTVTGTANTPVAGVLVVAFDTKNTADESDDDIVGLTTSDNNGAYALTGLATGSYALLFETDVTFDANVTAYIAEYYNDKAILAQADLVAVTAGSTVANINVALTQGGQIRGTVTGADTGVGVEGVLVEIYAAGNLSDFVGFAITDDTGAYASTALTPGSYIVRFDPTLGDPFDTYAAEFYNNSPTSAAATTVAVAGITPVTGIDAALDLNP